MCLYVLERKSVSVCFQNENEMHEVRWVKGELVEACILLKTPVQGLNKWKFRPRHVHSDSPNNKGVLSAPGCGALPPQVRRTGPFQCGALVIRCGALGVER